MIKKVIIAGIMGLSLCTPHIKAEVAQATQSTTEEIHATKKAKKPLYVPVESEQPFDQRFINFLIAFWVELAFVCYQSQNQQTNS